MKREPMAKQIEKHPPETPGHAWRCPKCKALRDGMEFFCDHETTNQGALSRDTAPRLARATG